MMMQRPTTQLFIIHLSPHHKQKNYMHIYIFSFRPFSVNICKYSECVWVYIWVFFEFVLYQCFCNILCSFALPQLLYRFLVALLCVCACERVTETETMCTRVYIRCFFFPLFHPFNIFYSFSLGLSLSPFILIDTYFWVCISHSFPFTLSIYIHRSFICFSYIYIFR